MLVTLDFSVQKSGVQPPVAEPSKKNEGSAIRYVSLVEKNNRLCAPNFSRH